MCDTFLDKNTKILATGGASLNKSILQVMADVFNVPVYVQVSKTLRMLNSYKINQKIIEGNKKFSITRSGISSKSWLLRIKEFLRTGNILSATADTRL